MIKHQAGVTLIEVMVTLAILIIVIMLGLPSFATMIANSKLRGEADAFRSALARAKMEAVKRNEIVAVTRTGNAWKVSFTPTNGAETLLFDQADKDMGVSYAGSDTISFAGNGQSFPMGSTATFNLTAKNKACRDAGQDGIVCLNVMVGNGGSIKTCDPVLTKTDSRSCSYGEPD